MALREALVARGARFLRNSKVQDTSLEEKLTFLRQKGLTEAEIAEALRRCSPEALRLEAVFTENMPRPTGAFSQAVKIGDWLFCSGVTGVNGTPEVARDAAKQATNCMQRLRAVLLAAGANFKNVVKATVLLRSMDDYAAVNAAYEAALREGREDDKSFVLPARCCFAVAGLPKGALVEIEAIARILPEELKALERTKVKAKL